MKIHLIIPLLFTIFFTSSCAKFINKIHRDLDKGQSNSNRRSFKKKHKNDSFDRFRNPYYSSNRKKRLSDKSPQIQRKYNSKARTKRRYTTDDLADNQADGSLWSGRGNNNYLFSLDQERKSGDIVVINVFDRLKKEIRMELKRSLPAPRIKKQVGASPEDSTAPKKPVAEAPKKPNAEGDSKDVFDKISSVIIEKINKDHFLIRGQKQILFKNKKRLVEIQALIAKRDIEENDTVHSDKILESNVYLIR